MTDYNQFSIQIYNNVNSNPRGPTPTKGPNGSYVTKKWNDLLTALGGDITAIESQISSNTGNISSNLTNLNSLDTRITTNEGDISSQDARITTNEGDISSQDARITTNEADISSQDTRITSLESGNGGGLTSNQILVKTDNFSTTVNSIEYQDFISQGGMLTPKIIVHHFPFYIPFYYPNTAYTCEIRDLSADGKEILYPNNSLTVGGIFDVDESATHTDISSVFDTNGEGYYFVSLATLDNNASGGTKFRVLANNPLSINLTPEITEGRIERFSATKNERFFDAEINYPTGQGNSVGNTVYSAWNFQWDMLLVRNQFVKAEISLDYNA